jgi:hypothetical protein
MLNLSNFGTSRRGAIEARIDALREELASLTQEASRYGGDAYESTRRAIPHLASDMESLIEQAWPLMQKRARRVERLARDNPTATAATVGLIALGLLATVIYSRR